MNRLIKKTTLNSFALILILCLSGFVLSGCSNNAGANTSYYMVSYTTRVGEAPKPVKVKAGTVLNLENLPEISAENYTFDGWYIGEEKIYPGSYTVADNIVLTASWIGKECSVTFTHSDNISGNTFTKIYNLGEKITLPENPYGQITGLEFLGWFNDNVYYNEYAEYTLSKDVVFTAVYAENGTHTISYYNVVDGTLYEGSGFDGIEYLIGEPNPTSFTESQTVFISGIKTIGYTFGGWYNGPDCRPEDKALTFWRAGEVQQNVVLYAMWTMQSYTIRFDGNSGTLIDANDPQESVSLRFDEEITLPVCKYELTGYAFVGWTVDTENFEKEFDQNVKTSVESLAPFANGNTITLYVHWRDAVEPAAPTDLQVTEVDIDSVSLQWKPADSGDLAFTRLSYKSKDETSYKIVDFLAEKNIYDENGVLQDSSYTVTNLKFGEIYYFTVTSFDVAGNSSLYNSACTVCAVTRSKKKFAPKLNFSQSSTSRLVISWDTPTVEEFPYIENISLYVNNSKEMEITAVNGQGECYTTNQATVDVDALSLYTIQLKIQEKVDEAGRTNTSESEVYNYLSEPAFNVSESPVSIYGEQKVCWKYETELGFSLTKPADSQLPPGITESSYVIYAECTPLDSNGIPDKSLTTMGKLLYDSNRDLYIRSNLETGKDYDVKIFIEVTDVIDSVSYTSCSRAIAITFDEPCSTASVRGSMVGYACYSSTVIYPEIQKTGTPIGIVTKVNNLNVPVTIMAIKDLCDLNGDVVAVTGLNEAQAKLKTYTEGGFIWNVPTKEEIENIFDVNNVEKIFRSLQAGGGLFTPSYTTTTGQTFGRYITSTESTAGNVYAFDIDEYNNCGNPASVPTQNSGVTFVVRPVVRFSN